MRSWVTFFVAAALSLTAAAALGWSMKTVVPPLEGTPAPVRPPILNGERLFLTKQQVAQGSGTDVRDRSIRSILNVEQPLRYGEFVWNDRGVPAGPVWVRVDLHSQLISVFRSGHEIGTAVVLYGAEKKETPRGVFPILMKDRNHRSSTYDAAMPYTLRLTQDGISIHGSAVRWGYATHGCIGVPLGFAEQLFRQVKKGDTVVILAGSADTEHKSSAIASRV